MAFDGSSARSDTPLTPARDPARRTGAMLFI
jgi:hypothetical protein